MIDISALNTEDVIVQSRLDEFERGVTVLHLQLARLNVNIYLIEKILQFVDGQTIHPLEAFHGQEIHPPHGQIIHPG